MVYELFDAIEETQQEKDNKKWEREKYTHTHAHTNA